MSKIIEHNVETGEVIERDMTADELIQWESDKAEQEAIANAEVERATKRSAALAKLEALGLDEDDLKALGLGGN